MSKYIVIPNIKVQNANAQPAYWMVSAPSITAYVGFAHALAMCIGEKAHEGIAIVHHDIQFLGEKLTGENGQHNLFPHQFRAAGFIDKDDYVANGHSLSDQPTARCHLNISLVVAMPEKSKIDSTSIERFLRGARLAGGSIIKFGEIKYDCNNHEAAINAIRKTGFSIVERQDLMELQNGDRDIIDVILRNTLRYVEKPNKEKLTDNTGWIVPSCLGYTGISSLKKRNKSRNELPHIYVEPLVGLIQYQSVRTAGLHFWRYKNPQTNLFIVTTN